MGGPTTKTNLIIAATTNHERMNAFISELTEKELSTPFISPYPLIINL